MHPKRLKDINQSDIFVLQFNVLFLSSCRHRRILVCTVYEYLTTSTQMYVFGNDAGYFKTIALLFQISHNSFCNLLSAVTTKKR